MPTPTAEIGEQELREAFAVNVFAPFLLTGLIAPAMVERGHGASSTSDRITGLRGSAGSAVYSGTKATLHSFTKSWADEYGPSGVRVNAVAPGHRDRTCGGVRRTRRPDAGPHPVTADDHAREVAAAVVFLASDDAANIHGTVLSVDGGWAAV